jgi:hypothetical protein
MQTEASEEILSLHSRSPDGFQDGSLTLSKLAVFSGVIGEGQNPNGRTVFSFITRSILRDSIQSYYEIPDQAPASYD